MADAEGLQALQRTPEIPVHLFKAQQGVGADRNALSLPAQPILRQGVEPFLEWMHLLRRHGEATGCRMTAETFQQITAAVQGGIHGKSGWCPHGGPQAAIPLSRQQGGRPVIALNQARRHDADDAVMPVTLSQQQERRRQRKRTRKVC